MKPVNRMLLIVALLPFADSALADGVSGVQRPQQVMSDKDKWACEVAMCLANPQGPTAVSECKPPINKMRRELAKGNSIPKCRFLGSNRYEKIPLLASANGRGDYPSAHPGADLATAG